MAFDKAHFENPHSGKIRSAPMGFSWTTFFFGPFPMLFRGAWKWFFIVLLTGLLTFGLSGLIWIFIINRLYLNDLVKDGYRLRGADRSHIDMVIHYAGRPLPIMETEGV